MTSTQSVNVEEGASYAGWPAGGIAILAIMLTGAYLWFSYHP
ncbi:MAG: hypothetical protein WAN87_05900 [Thermoplasmata archaeon]